MKPSLSTKFPRFLRIKWQIIRFCKRLTLLGQHSVEWTNSAIKTNIRLRMFLNRRHAGLGLGQTQRADIFEMRVRYFFFFQTSARCILQASGMCERIFSISACLQVLYTARLVYTQADEENAARQCSFVDGRPKGITMETFIVRNPLNQRVYMNLVQFFLRPNTFFLTPTTSSQMERQRFRHYCWMGHLWDQIATFYLDHSSPVFIWLVVEPTHLKNTRQNGNLPQVGVKIKDIWNHHLVHPFQTGWLWSTRGLLSSSIWEICLGVSCLFKAGGKKASVYVDPKDP